MPSIRIEMHYYTYAYLREDKTPYYIGKGIGNRAYVKHMRKDDKNLLPKDKSKIILLKKNLTEEEAFKHEIYMIGVFGRIDLGTGILYNMTNGGFGGSSKYDHLTENERKEYELARKNEWQRNWRKNNRTKTNEFGRKSYWDNRTKKLKYSNDYKNKNRELINEKQKNYRKENKELVNEKQRNYRKENRDEYNRKQNERNSQNRDEYNKKQRERRKIKRLDIET